MEERSRRALVRSAFTVLTLLSASAPAPLFGLPATASPALTLQQSVERALEENPDLQAAEARLREAQGRLSAAQTYPLNPVLEGGAASRDGAGESTTDFEIALGQEIELAGQRGRRIESSRAELAAERKRLQRAKQVLVAQVHLAFIAALEARELLEVTRTDAELAERLYELAQRRLDRGAGTQLDVNVAAAELGRAEGRFHAAEADYQRARADLAQAIGMDPSALPIPQGRLAADLRPAPPLEEVLESARAHRADLQALESAETARRAQHGAARSEAWPNLTLRAFGGREEGTDRIIGGGLSIPLPVFNRNQGRIEEALAGVHRAQAERRAGQIAVDSEVVAAHARYQAGMHTAERLRRLVFGTLEQTLDLLQRSFTAGKATWPEVIVIRRTLVDAQRELTSAEAEARRAWTDLQLAMGSLPLPDDSAAEEQP